jgi:hypothetical protein
VQPTTKFLFLLSFVIPPPIRIILVRSNDVHLTGSLVAGRNDLEDHTVIDYHPVVLRSLLE